MGEVDVSVLVDVTLEPGIITFEPPTAVDLVKVCVVAVLLLLLVTLIILPSVPLRVKYVAVLSAMV